MAESFEDRNTKKNKNLKIYLIILFIYLSIYLFIYLFIFDD